jgi:hypothetical protein
MFQGFNASMDKVVGNGLLAEHAKGRKAQAITLKIVYDKHELRRVPGNRHILLSITSYVKEKPLW